MSAAGKRWMARVADLPCVVCRKMSVAQNGQTFVHHCFDNARRSDFLVIALCYEHHQGGTGFHGMGERAFNMRYKTDETQLVGKTVELVASSIG